MKWVKRWYVESFTSTKGKVYTVSLAEDDETWGCSCPHWTRNVPRPLCKHIRQVQEMGDMDRYVGSVNIKVDEFFTEEEFTV